MKYLTERVWPLTVAVIGFIVANGDAIVSVLQGELDRAGGEFSWKTLLFIVMAFVTMANVWSKSSARKLAISDPHILGD